MGTLDNSRIIAIKVYHGATDHLRTMVLIKGRKIIIFRSLGKILIVSTLINAFVNISNIEHYPKYSILELYMSLYQSDQRN